MKIRLETARAEPFRWQESIEPTAAGLALEEPAEISPIAVSGTLSWVAPSYLLRARLRYRQTAACDRCLAPVTEEVEVPLDMMVAEASGGAAEGGEHQLRESELGVLEVEGEWLETEPLVVEQVHLQRPTHPLCREDCKGLCPRCGKDLNEGDCGCAKDEADPRWAPLAALRGNPKDDDRDGRS